MVCAPVRSIIPPYRCTKHALSLTWRAQIRVVDFVLKMLLTYFEILIDRMLYIV